MASGITSLYEDMRRWPRDWVNLVRPMMRCDSVKCPYSEIKRKGKEEKKNKTKKSLGDLIGVWERRQPLIGRDSELSQDWTFTRSTVEVVDE